MLSGKVDELMLRSARAARPASSRIIIEKINFFISTNCRLLIPRIWHLIGLVNEKRRDFVCFARRLAKQGQNAFVLLTKSWLGSRTRPTASGHKFRIYNLEGIEDDIIIQKGFIKSRISNDSDGNNKVFSINQISNNGDFVISMATDSEPKKGKNDEEITLSEKEKDKDKDKIIVKKDEQNNKTELESKASEGLIKIYKFETLLSTEEDITV